MSIFNANNNWLVVYVHLFYLFSDGFPTPNILSDVYAVVVFVVEEPFFLGTFCAAGRALGVSVILLLLPLDSLSYCTLFSSTWFLASATCSGDMVVSLLTPPLLTASFPSAVSSVLPPADDGVL